MNNMKRGFWIIFPFVENRYFISIYSLRVQVIYMYEREIYNFYK